MRFSYIDLVLVHWPLALQTFPNLPQAKATPDATNEQRCIATDRDGRVLIDWQYTCKVLAEANHQEGSIKPAWQTMQNLVTKGKAWAVGVSNFNIEQLNEVIAVGGSIPLSCNQVEANP